MSKHDEQLGRIYEIRTLAGLSRDATAANISRWWNLRETVTELLDELHARDVELRGLVKLWRSHCNLPECGICGGKALRADELEAALDGVAG